MSVRDTSGAASQSQPTRLITDFDQLSQMFAGWDGRLEQMSAGKFQGKLSVVQGQSVRVMEVESNRSILLKGQAAKDFFTIHPVSESETNSLFQGRRLAPGSLVCLGPNAETDHRSAKRVSARQLSLRMDQLIRTASIVRNAEVKGPAMSWFTLSPPPDKVNKLVTGIQQLLLWRPHQSTLKGNFEGRQVEQDCLRAAINLIFPIDENQIGHDIPLPVRTQLTKRAEEFMRANLRNPLGAIDLCEALGVSDRTLRLAFRERFGIGPMVYYKKLRLNAVRSNLKLNRAANVATVANEFGFQHLGNFAADYRRLFGLLPSQTFSMGD